MNRIKKKILLCAISALMCASFALTPVFSVINSYGDKKNQGSSSSVSSELSLTEVNNLQLADTSSAFKADYKNETAQSGVVGEHYVIVTLEGDGIIDSSDDVTGYIGSSAAEKKKEKIAAEQQTFLKRLKAAKIPYAFRYAYDTVINAVAIKTDVKYLEKISKIRGVKSAEVSEYYYAPKDVAVTNEANVWGTGIYKVDGVSSGYDGSGMVVAVLDTGLDASHEAFRKMPASGRMDKEEVRNKIFGGAADKGLVAKNKKVTADDVYYNEKVPFAYDYADNDADVYPSYSSHGTHVAGIIAGTPIGEDGKETIKDIDGNEILDKDGNPMTFTGVAPEAQLAICKVFTDIETAEGLGGAETADILAALEDCVKLGVDVINMSLGSSAGFTKANDEYMQTVYDNVRKAGISLMVAASNDYSSAYNGVYGTNLATNPDSATVGSPSTFESAMSVASINGQKARYIRIGEKDVYTAKEDDKFLYFTEASDGNGNQKEFVKDLLKKYGNSDKMKNGVLQLEYQVVPGYGLAVNYTKDIDVNGKVAVVRRGGDVTFEEKVRVAKAKGAVACVIYNNVSGVIRMSLGNLHDPVPTCSITMDAANNFVSNKRGYFYISDGYKAGPFMSDFSSWGPTPDLRLKPEISAHGGEITSAVPNGWDEYSGTSMATPNLAGAMSLVLGYINNNKGFFPMLSSETGIDKEDKVTIANRLMMSTATIAYDEFGFPYSPRKQGAGLADINKAMTTQAYIYVPGSDKTKIETFDSQTGEFTLSFNVKNLSSSQRKYKISTKTMTETIASDKLTVAERAYMLDELCEITIDGDGVSAGMLTLAGNADAQVTVTIKLGNEAKKYIDDNFRNGMYVEGFVSLEDATGDEKKVNLNVPWLGFYGDWYAAPMFDISEYELADALQNDSIPDEDKPKAAMYATVPLGSYKNKQYIIPLGTYLYELPSDAKKIYSSSDKAALSVYDEKGHYTVNELYAIYAGLLRGAEEMAVTITDAVTGEVVFYENMTNVRKAYTGGSSTARAAFVEMKWSPLEKKLDNNKQYLFKMEGKLASMPTREYKSSDYDYNKSFEFNFYVDTEAPEITDYRIRYESYKDANDKIKYNVYLDIDVYDNHYAQSVALCYADMNEMTLELLESQLQPVYGTRNSTTTVSIDITDYYKTEKELYIQVDDYALNARAYMVKNFKSFAESVEYPTSIEITSGTDVAAADYKKEITVGVNEAKKLEIAVAPSTAASVNLLWKSYDENVVRVKDGELFGVKAGAALVKVFGGINEHSDVYDAILVHVTASENSAPAISKLTLDLIQNEDGAMVDPTNAYVNVHQNKQFRLNAIVEPWYYTGTADIRWTTTAPDVAAVTSGGVVKTLKEGGATIKGTLFVDGKQTIYTVSTMLTVGPEFKVQNGYLREYHGAGGKVTIPKSLNVYYIYEEAFKDNDNIVELEISSPCTEIQPYAFSNMKKLKRLVLPSTVNYVYRYAFFKCESLETIELHSRSITFGAHAFEGCKSLKTIKNVELKNGLKQEDVQILDLTEGKDYVTKTARLTTVGDFAFKDCTGIVELDLSELRVAGENAFMSCKGLTTLTLSKFTAISDDMFLGCTNLNKLIYTDLTAADLSAIYYRNAVSPFGNAAIKEIELPDGLAVIEKTANGFEAIYNKDKTVLIKVNQTLQSFTVPETVTEIAANAFAGGKIKSVTFAGNGLKKIGNYAFSGTHLSSVKLPSGIEEMGVGVFSWCEMMTSADLVDITLKELPAMTFALAGDEESGFTVTLSNTITSLGEKCFYGSAIKELDLSASGVNEIGNDAFADCQYLSSVKLGKITALGDGAFAAKSSKEIKLAAVSFGEGSSVLGTNTFFGQKSLKEVKLSAEQEKLQEIGAGVFAYCTALKSLPVKPVVAGDYAFAGCSALTLDLSAIERAGAGAFRGCKPLTATLDKLEKAGDYAFADCSALGVINLAGAVEIGEGAFKNCAKVNVSGINEALKKIGKFAFFKTGIEAETFSIPSGIEEIGEGAFSALRKVKAFAIENNPVYYAEKGALMKKVPNGAEILAFPAGKSGEATLSDGTVRVAASAFEDASGVTKVTFPYSMKAIGDKAFYNCGATEYVFGCLQAPVLEAAYIKASDFDASSDMYKLLDESGEVATEKYYGNFKDYAAKVIYAGYKGIEGIKDLGLTATCPQNATGFDNRIYAGYFGSIVRTEIIADDTARDCVLAIEAVPEAEDVAALAASDSDEWKSYKELMAKARAAYNTVTATQRKFVTNADKLLASEAAMRSKASTFAETVTEKSLDVFVRPDKTAYVRGEKFDATGMVLTLTYSDGSKTEITEGYEIVTKNALTENNRTVRIRYNDLTTTLNVIVVKPDVAGIEINTEPTQKEYEKGDEFSTAGLTLKVNYVDGTSEVVYDGYVVKNGAFDKTGKTAVTIEYGGKSLEIEVEVVSGEPTPPAPEPDKPDEEKKGCGASAFDSFSIAFGVGAIAIAAAFVLVKNKKRKD